MAANKEGSSSLGHAPNSNGVSVNPTNNRASSSSAPSATSETQAALRHNSGISIEWTPEEQSTLDDLLAKYASDSNIIRYAKIAMQLKSKTVRDVALRCNWMTKKESGKRRREDHNSSRKNKERKICLTGEGCNRFFNKVDVSFDCSPQWSFIRYANDPRG